MIRRFVTVVAVAFALLGTAVGVASAGPATDSIAVVSPALRVGNGEALLLRVSVKCTSPVTDPISNSYYVAVNQKRADGSVRGSSFQSADEFKCDGVRRTYEQISTADPSNSTPEPAFSTASVLVAASLTRCVLRNGECSYESVNKQQVVPVQNTA